MKSTAIIFLKSFVKIPLVLKLENTEQRSDVANLHLAFFYF